MKSHDPGKDQSEAAADTGRLRELFKRSVDRLDPAAGNRLRLMRREAQARAGVRRIGGLALVGSAAVAALVIGIGWWLPRATQPMQSPTPAVAQADELPFPAEDDVELYAWLGDAPVAVDPPDGSL